jgi:hypothetical protein
MPPLLADLERTPPLSIVMAEEWRRIHAPMTAQ